jgi:hypothetical protein
MRVAMAAHCEHVKSLVNDSHVGTITEHLHTFPEAEFRNQTAKPRFLVAFPDNYKADILAFTQQALDRSD